MFMASPLIFIQRLFDVYYNLQLERPTFPHKEN